MAASTLALAPARAEAERWTVRDVYLSHAKFIWRSLQRLGVSEADLDDCLQEVLIVVHRRLRSYDPNRCKLTTWLFGITLRIAKRHHRRVHRRRERPADARDERVAPGMPDAEVDRLRAQRRLQQILATMSVEKRATFVLFEIEGMKADTIADMMGVPVGTVYSRLHAARGHFARALDRERAVQRRRHG